MEGLCAKIKPCGLRSTSNVRGANDYLGFVIFLSVSFLEDIVSSIPITRNQMPLQTNI